jgi:crossover junction endodeoxyribonuclease RuvC
MRALAIDPSLASSGFAVINPDGTLYTAGKFTTSDCKATPNEQERLKAIYDFFSHLIDVTGASVLVMEEQYVGKNALTAMKLSRVRGILMLLAAQKGLKLITFKPSVIKHAVCGPKKGNASKEEVYNAVRALYAEKDPQLDSMLPEGGMKDSGKQKNDDISDAIAIAHTYVLYQEREAV